MAFFDGHTEKKKDTEAEYMEYQILRGMTDEEEEEDKIYQFVFGENSGPGFWLCFSVVMIVIVVPALMK